MCQEQQKFKASKNKPQTPTALTFISKTHPGDESWSHGSFPRHTSEHALVSPSLSYNIKRSLENTCKHKVKNNARCHIISFRLKNQGPDAFVEKCPSSRCNVMGTLHCSSAKIQQLNSYQVGVSGGHEEQHFVPVCSWFKSKLKIQMK